MHPVIHLLAQSRQIGCGSSFMWFLDHTQRRTTVGRTLDEWPARRRDIYLTTHNNHNRQTSMSPVGFEPTTPAGEWPQTYDMEICSSKCTFKKNDIGNYVVSQVSPVYLDGFQNQLVVSLQIRYNLLHR